MANYYIYLISSLPSLDFNTKPPFLYEYFLNRCRDLIPEEDMAVMQSIQSPVFTCIDVKNQTLVRWRSFETMLRNELVKIRAARRKKDPAQYLREDACPESSHAAHIAINAYRRPVLIESERALDHERWRYLDELAIGHYFDLDILVLYACKLKILEKWNAITSADADAMTEEVLTR